MIFGNEYIKYKAAQKGAYLVTNGDLISNVVKVIKQGGSSGKDFIQEIRERTMTEENKKHFRRVVSEMASSEKVHLDGLNVLNEVYLKPIVGSGDKDWMPLCKKIQTDIMMLINVHKKFHAMMETTLKNATEEKLPVFGEDFIKQLQFLKMASNYLTKYPEYLEQMTTKLSKEKNLIKLQEKAKEQYMKDNGVNVQAVSFYLITPVQRIPRYELLLRDMLKDTGKDYEGLENLIKALNKPKYHQLDQMNIKLKLKKVKN